jgi:NhaA family Na+:H+ antiporter
LKWKHVTGIGVLGGIGFTMSIFITLLAYDDPAHITMSKMATLLASLVAGTLGYFWASIHVVKNRRVRRSMESMTEKTGCQHRRTIGMENKLIYF